MSVPPVALSVRGLVAALAILASPASAQLQFTDVSIPTNSATPHNDLGFMMGASCGFLDYNNDGWMDILLTGSTQSPFLLRNDGGNFAHVETAIGIAPVMTGSFGMAVACADYDNDGDTDIFLANSGFNKLYRNDGGTFTDVTVAAGVIDLPPTWSSSAVFGDYDGDGFLDLYVGNYIKQLSYPFHTPFPNALYHNQGDGTFLNVTTLCGVGGAGTTLATQWTDFDHDGDLDLWVANDFGAFVQPNQLYRNDGPLIQGGLGWKFTEIAGATGADAGIYCMGVTGGDIDHDLDLDYYFSNLGRNVLLRNDGAAGFTDITTPSGTEGTFDPSTSNPTLLATSWGVGFHDFDGDGWVDLFVSNGYIPAAAEIANGQATPNFLYRNNADGTGTFTDVTMTTGTNDAQIGRGCAFADFDNDGDIDILQGNINGISRLFRNDAPPHHWLRIVPIGRMSNRDGNGAWMTAHLNAFTLVREANAHYSFEASSDRAIQFATGGEAEVPHIEIRWPSGIEQNLYHAPTDMSVELVEPILTCDPTVKMVPRIHAGETLHLPLVVENHFSTPKLAIYGIELRGPTWTWHAGYNAASIPAKQRLDLGTTLLIPTHGPFTLPVDVEVIYTVFDKDGGFDQWSGKVRVTQ